MLIWQGHFTTSTPAASVTRAQAFDFLESYRATPVLAARLRMELGSAWHYALDAGRLPENTANWWKEVLKGRLKSKGRKIEGKYTGTQKRVLSVHELGTLIRWLPNFSLTVADALTLYLWTGTRGGEIVAMESTEIAEEADGLWWTIPKQKTKVLHNEKAPDLRVPLIGRAEVVVRRRLDQVKGTFKSAIHLARVYGERKQNFVGQHFWARGYFVSTVGRDEQLIREYIKHQEQEDQRLDQMRLW